MTAFCAFDYHDQPMVANMNMPTHLPVNIQARIHNAQQPRRSVQEILASLEASEKKEQAILRSLKGDVRYLIDLLKPLTQ